MTEDAADVADTAVIRVLIADDHPVVRDGLRGTFAAEPDIEVVGDAGNGRDTVERAVHSAVDVVLMDLRMPVMDGVQAIAALAKRAPRTRVLRSSSSSSG